MQEEWKDIEGYEGSYQISNMGQVKSLKKKNPGRILFSSIDQRGYVQVKLSKDGVSKSLKVHRLVAVAYLPNPEGKKTVNHINGIKCDNRPCNLEWATYSENLKHSYDTNLPNPRINPHRGKFGKLHHNVRKVIRYNDLYSFEFYGTREAGDATNYSRGAIAGFIKRGTRDRDGYLWVYYSVTEAEAP